MASASQVSRALRGPMVTIALVGFYPTKGFAASVSQSHRCVVFCLEVVEDGLAP